ncbi:glycoside hydrolase family 15 protein [Paraburkholderia rhynchosiae]|uniref:Glucoamylase n=1 Tax=Paraburkholderia rhynchosiae TaxID=487049 RepID=A0A2N7VPJ0_9BURK|nr:glycoside hydrolase family 15 protein [Paraburkholderia rhynchosiae]PMS19015.1 glucoamylase [Paraburkholderia rhynchosiae]CAB3743266.1 Trehalase [Paraburkholderia rhynchosiae]
MSRPIEDYALLGDGETAALVSRGGSIDWLCWPRFDGSACFAALLGTRGNGYWSIAPTGAVVRHARRYQPDTLVMETDFDVRDGEVRLIDFMPIGNGPSSLVRIVEGLRGVVKMRSQIRLRFDYGALSPWITCVDDTVQARVGADLVVLRADVDLQPDDESIEASFEVAAGARVAFVMSHGLAHESAPQPPDPETALVATQRYWREWIGGFDDSRTAWPAAVRRSLLTLKALTYRRTGAIVASPTTSLPEAPAGELNWDYRYCWLRDTSFALVALLNAGFQKEARAWRDWLLRTIAGSPEGIRVMYRVDGDRHLPERSVDWLRGYRYARPVRVGNAAAAQHQVDVLGEIIDCLDVARRGGLSSTNHDDVIEKRIVDYVAQVWNTPGSGIWESRSAPRHYTYSRVMAWVAIDRFIAHRATNAHPGEPEPHERWRALRQTIHDEICREAWNEGLGTFTQSYGDEELDGSLLLMPLVGFLPADDPRMASTIATIRRELSDDGLIRRRKKSPNGPNEGVFLACSCWMADCLHMQGRDAEAREQFERVLAIANDLGLLAEQYNTEHRQLAGNFPQALTHLSVINTALGLCGPTLQRGGG